MKRLIVSGCMALTMAGMGAASVGAPATHAAVISGAMAAQLRQCTSGGWQSVTQQNGTHFANERACIVYVVRGGKFA